MAEKQPIYWVSIPEGRLGAIASLSTLAGNDIADYFVCGSTPDHVPVVRSRTKTGNLFSVDLEA